jgi:hypothetical protein
VDGLPSGGGMGKKEKVEEERKLRKKDRKG